MEEKKKVVRHREGTSFRFRPDTLQLIDKLSEQLGINKTAVVEMAVRKLAGREKVKIEKPGTLFAGHDGKEDARE